MMSRREALLTGALAGLGAGTAAAPRAAPGAVDPLARAAFTPLVGAALTLAGSGGEHAVTLVSAPGRDDAYSLRFATTGPVPEGIYRLHHPDLAPVDLFLAPTGPTGDRLDAVVNRSRA